MGGQRHSRHSRACLAGLTCGGCLIACASATYWDPASPVCELSASNTGICAWTGECLLDDCNRKCVANAKDPAKGQNIDSEKVPVETSSETPVRRKLQDETLEDLNEFRAARAQAFPPTAAYWVGRGRFKWSRLTTGCPSDEEVDEASDRLSETLEKLYQALAYLPTESLRDAKQVQDAEIWSDLIQVVGDTGTLKHFFKDYCMTDVVQDPIADLYQDAMSIPLADRQGKLLVCRDNGGHAEPAVAGLQKILDQCLESIWNVQRSWCLGDGGAYLTLECMNAYGEFLDIPERQISALVKVFDNVQAYCANELTESDCHALHLAPESEAIRTFSVSIYHLGTDAVQSWRPELVKSIPPQANEVVVVPSKAASSNSLMWLTATAAALCGYFIASAW